MNYWLFLIPLIGAITGWIIQWAARKFFFSRILPKRQPQIAAQLGKIVSTDLFSFSQIEQKISDPANFQKIMPLVEKHVDEFLRVKLSQQMPMISMFIGDKTINTLKTVFLQELETLFPQVMKEFAGNLKNEFDPEQVIVQKVSAFPPQKLEALLAKDLRRMEYLGALTGFITGLFQLLITILTA